MKRILHYAVVKDYNLGFKIIRVTSERGRQVYGRLADDASTHVAARDVIARLPDDQTAQSFMARAGRIKAKHANAIAAAQRDLSAAFQAERRELDQLVTSVQQA